MPLKTSQLFSRLLFHTVVFCLRFYVYIFDVPDKISIVVITHLTAILSSVGSAIEKQSNSFCTFVYIHVSVCVHACVCIIWHAQIQHQCWEFRI